MAGKHDLAEEKKKADALAILNTLKQEGFEKDEVIALLEELYKEETC